MVPRNKFTLSEKKRFSGILYINNSFKCSYSKESHNFYVFF